VYNGIPGCGSDVVSEFSAHLEHIEAVICR